MGDDPTQYWSLHPLGPWAEYLRWQQITDEADLLTISGRVWAARFDIDPGSLLELSFDTAPTWGVSAQQLVGDDHAPCQAAAVAIRAAGYRGLVAPSAALPGASTLALFGARMMSPYELPAPDEDLDVPCALLTEHGGPPTALLSLVRHWGSLHEGLQAWETGGDSQPIFPSYR